jgi:hypothetical protein
MRARDVRPVEIPERFLAISDPELDVAGPLEVRLHPEELRVPLRRRHVVRREQVDRAHPVER